MTRPDPHRHTRTRAPRRTVAAGARSAWYRQVEPQASLSVVVWRLYRACRDGAVAHDQVSCPVLELSPSYGGRRRMAATLRLVRKQLKEEAR